MHGWPVPLLATAPDDLARSFASPPDSAKPTVYWHWVNDNISKAGITADLEEMRRVGIGGATIAWVGLQIPDGTVKFRSAEWYNMIQFAGREASRLGLTLEIAPGEGWAAGGGTWIDPAHSMLRVTTSEIHVTGTSHFDGLLPQPPSKLGFYRDIAVLAFRTPPATEVKMAQFSPKVTSSDPGFNGLKVVDGDAGTTAVLKAPAAGMPQYIQLEFAKPFQVRGVTITPGGQGIYSAAGEIQSSDDGVRFAAVHGFWMDRGTDPQSWSVKTTSARFYRIVFNKGPAGYNGGGAPAGLTIAEVSLQPSLVIAGLVGKADVIRNDWMRISLSDTAPAELALDPSRMIDLSKQIEADGHLHWDTPKGDWTILRLGYTSTGSINTPATPDATGLECDKLSSEAAELLWSGLTKKILDAVGPLAGRTLTTSWIDSYEAGSQNWTPGFEAEFLKRRGYDLLPYLPVFAGYVVDSPEKTERFLWDLRRTIADLCADNFYGHFAQMAHRAGLQFATEPYGDGPFEDIQAGRDADFVRGEFWPGRIMMAYPKLAASVGHIYGKNRIGEESFTDFQGRWQNTPSKLKPLGDMVFTLGTNFLTLHEFAHTPWLSHAPGMTLGQWGSNFNRDVTWAEQGVGWMQYLARCQYLLQQGHCVVDFLIFNGEKVPASVGEDNPVSCGRRTGPLAPPLGFDYDECSEDLIIDRLSTKDGQLVVPGGMSYRALVLPRSDTMRPELLRKLKKLADAGATIIGPKPLKSPSLSDYPQCDQEISALGDELWNGKKIIDLKSMAEIVPALALKPDFEFQDKTARLLYTHRSFDGGDLYFISNQKGDYQDTDCIFRTHGRLPELWHPDTGEIEKVAAYTEEGDRTRIPMRFDPSGSIFVIFREEGPRPPADHPVSLSRVNENSTAPQPTLKITKATYGATQKGGGLDVTAQVVSLVRSGGLSMTVDPDYFGKDPAPKQEKQLTVEYIYNAVAASKTALDRDRLTLGNAAPAARFPDAKLLVAPDQSLRLEAWRAGVYKAKTSAGKEFEAKVDGGLDAIEVNGPWELSFPAHWGAPDKVVLPQLISWSDHGDSGVRYFSGTATYRKTLSIPAGITGPSRHLFLDLGDVQVIAEVWLNGKDLGVLWKPPYCLEITHAAKPGDNDLQVKVTNLWQNRLIGDEQLPPDREWVGPALKEWPDWLLKNQPSPTGRFTFNAWHTWTKDDPLLRSGLLGPVTVTPAIDAAMK